MMSIIILEINIDIKPNELEIVKKLNFIMYILYIYINIYIK